MTESKCGACNGTGNREGPKRIGIVVGNPYECERCNGTGSKLIELINERAFGGDHARPFNGQRHTFSGERGKAALAPMRLRDLADVIVSALDGFPGLEKVDLDAVAQSILTRIEKEGSE